MVRKTNGVREKIGDTVKMKKWQNNEHHQQQQQQKPHQLHT